MSLNWPIEITDSDIDEVERLMSVKFDEPRRLIIKNMTSIEVNACPGSGKTTLLVAKLAIMAKKWPFAYRGICVVSHTNVARNEIENKLGKTDVGRALLQYPHFIGTIQSFIDTYISIPNLKNKGNKIRLIDDEIVCWRRWYKLKYGSREYLERQYKNCNICSPIKFPDKYDVRIKETTPTYQDLIKVGDESRHLGDYTFSEMEQIADQAINELPNIAEMIQYRFPYVAVDETQDTKSSQWAIFEKLFPFDNTIIQSFGDANQAIYDFNSGDCDAQFPSRESPIQLNDSLRFGSEIANIANPVAVLKNVIGGHRGSFSNTPVNTIILFDERTMHSVVDAYAELVMGSFSSEELTKYAKLGVWVVGQVHRGNGSFAHDVSSYFKEYNAECIGTQLKLNHLIDFFRLGLKKKAESPNYVDGLNLFAKGVFSLFNQYPKDVTFVHNTTGTFGDLLNCCNDVAKEIRSLFLDLIKLTAIKKQQWDDFLEKMFVVFSNIIDFDMARRESSYIQWYEDDNPILRNEKINTLCYDKDGLPIEIHFGSIHSVKGMTHLATLVVETYRNTYNIKSILPWLSKQTKKNPNPGQMSRMKCLYVGMTRAMGLVCLALPKIYVNEKDLDALKRLGWNVKDLTSL